MELKKMPVTPIILNGKPVEAYSIQTANKAYKLRKTFGYYAARGFFTTVTKDGKNVRHFLPKVKFDEEILRFDPGIPSKGKIGRPATEDRLIALDQKVNALDQKVNKMLDILCALRASASLR